ncbi:MAG: translation elongation factor Ts [Deltaproteobacteria bacterium]|nr:translation elongation factor Ts [Deltaproteobacteria bacterium]
MTIKVTPQLTKELRERTGVGMMDCKKALDESGGDMEKAVELLQKRGLAKAAKKSGRIAAEGVVQSYIHGGGRIGVLLEVNCETDFAARSVDFRAFVDDIAMHVAAMSPAYLTAAEIPEAEALKQREIFQAQQAQSGKKPEIVEKIVEGQVAKWKKEICLLDQLFVKDDKKTIDQVRTELVAKIGENVSVRRYVRWELGEGLEKRKYDIAADVQAMLGQ